MKPRNHFKFLSLSLILTLAVGLYNCKPTPSEPEIPKFEEDFKGVKLPDVTVTKPAATTVTPAAIQTSAAVSSLTSGVSAGPSSPAVVTATTDMQKIVSTTEAASIAAAFTPTVVSNLQTTGTLPADLSIKVNAIASNPAFAAYLPKVTLPSVDGKPVTGAVKESTFDKNQPLITFPNYSVAAITSPCTDAAQAAYNTAKGTLDAARATQVSTVTTAYNTAVTEANASGASCSSSIPGKYTTLRTNATTQLTTDLAALAAAKDVLGETNYNLIVVLYYVAYANTISSLANLQAAELNACATLVTSSIAKAAAARDADLAGITNNYNTQLASLNTILTAGFQKCHDQGQG
ncbi:hypothetical protein [Emticicia sp. TH156]|uniref:hypothetical protein n=1 Tax=Emticicia sp. TH156 TaxID=2067454 RepID=UPI000C78A48A|nr:hypothetical protein [Emticicia sp. TH156]PLK44437.1 hypothetical protein C0V77_11680 [Emticicia sp. TH156]